jgi:hypothetical protein
MTINLFKGCDFHPCKGAEEWSKKLRSIKDTKEIRGLEWLFALSIHFLHIITVSGWIKLAYDPLVQPTDKPDEEELACRNRVIETWVLTELLVLLLLIALPAPISCWRIIGASYFLFEIMLNLSSIIFVGKLPGVYPPTPSVERSLLLFGFNVLQVILIFAVFYRAAFGFEASEAIFQAAFVLGTIDHPKIMVGNPWWWLVVFQILTDLMFLAVFLGAYVGNLGAFKRTR